MMALAAVSAVAVAVAFQTAPISGHHTAKKMGLTMPEIDLTLASVLAPCVQASLYRWSETTQTDCLAVSRAVQVVTEALIARALLLMHSEYVLNC